MKHKMIESVTPYKLKSTSTTLNNTKTCNNEIFLSGFTYSTTTYNYKRRRSTSLLMINIIILMLLCLLHILTHISHGAFAIAIAIAINNNNNYNNNNNNNINNNNIKIATHSLELTQNINIQRQEHVNKQCEMLGYSSTIMNFSALTDIQMDHMIVDREHKLLYCYVPKVACTNWKRVLMVLNGNWPNGSNPLEIPGHVAHSVGMFTKFNSLNETEKIQVLLEYTRSIFVRHPFERLLSAYRNKLEGKTSSARYFQRRIGRTIVKAFRVNPTNHSLLHGNDVTFIEFIRYLVTPELSMNNQSWYNEHWELSSKLCNPCVMNYNVIGKYETLLDDSALTLHLIGAENQTFPTTHKPSSTRARLKDYFDPLSIGVMRRLYEIYADDFRLFDYNLDEILGFDFG